MADAEFAKPSLWKDWYPPIKPEYTGVPLGESVDGTPIGKTLELFSTLPLGSKIWDAAGGDGRYALSLARMGYDVLVTDVDQRALRRLKDNTAILPPDSGKIVPVFADVTMSSPLRNGSVDAVLNTGFGYLIPPDELDPVFGSMSKALKPKGLFVFEFATNRIREKISTGKSLLGEKEYNYTREEGLEILTKMGLKYGIEYKSPIEEHRDVKFSDSHLVYDLILAHGVKKAA